METREKQAYMLMAHQCNEMFWTLLRMLDAPWNDIFIHMDSKNENYQPETVERYVKYAKVFHAQRTSAVWGGITLVKAEFVLLKAAVDHGPYQHYHLISGADLPIQPPEEDVYKRQAEAGCLPADQDPDRTAGEHRAAAQEGRRTRGEQLSLIHI